MPRLLFAKKGKNVNFCMFAKVLILKVNVRSLTTNYYTKKFVASFEVVFALVVTEFI